MCFRQMRQVLKPCRTNQPFSWAAPWFFLLWFLLLILHIYLGWRPWALPLAQGRHIPRSWREQAEPWQSDAWEPWHSGQDVGKERTPFLVATALPLLSRVYQSCLDADSFIMHLHTTPQISFSFQGPLVKYPRPDSQGHIALSGETYSRTKKITTASHGSHEGHRSHR